MGEIRTTRYFEANGEIRKLLLKKLDERRKAINALRDHYVSVHGGDNVGYSDGFGFTSCLAMQDKDREPVNPHLWRRLKNNPLMWTPRLSTKEGKAIAAEITRLEQAVVSLADLGAAIKLPLFDQLYLNLPGLYHVRGSKRLLIATRDQKYKPPKGMELVRISDVEFERLTADKPKRKAKVSA